ncbi:hypothetical protein [Legionella tucsonensis]|uniref:Transmembrane protein n=1 Tax=Legionella tucsonensis TaxID=40335 RepID=A0A0W0ZWE4_9GAMM|nr:hypothetical protein [Legionella tucsonensis]KTD73091.1 hypothetical protein Ltuc_0938 [Legionella tucsonensis]
MTKKKQEDDTNYTFLLRCMTALTAAAIVTAGVIAAVTLKSTTATAAAIATKTLLASAFIFTPILPIALVAIGLVFVLPFLFACNNNTYTTVRTTATPGYSSYGFYSPVYTAAPYGHYDTGSTVYVNNDHSHGHPTSHRTVHIHDGGHIHEHGGSRSHQHGRF